MMQDMDVLTLVESAFPRCQLVETHIGHANYLLEPTCLKSMHCNQNIGCKGGLSRHTMHHVSRCNCPVHSSGMVG